MQAFLAGIVKMVLQWAIEKLYELVRNAVARLKRHKEIDKQAEKSKKPLEEAKTEKEIDDAAKDVLGGM